MSFSGFLDVFAFLLAFGPMILIGILTYPFQLVYLFFTNLFL